MCSCCAVLIHGWTEHKTTDGIVALACRVTLGADEPFMEILPQVLSNYGLSVQYGHRHIYQSLPRMLTVWFQYGNYCYTYPRVANSKVLLS